jgi:CTP:molybdopterin cytidylyltransferase MocA
MSAPVAVILAAGKSTRMKSEVPKVLHPVCGRLMIEYVLDAARAAGAERLIVVVGHKADLVRSVTRSSSRCCLRRADRAKRHRPCRDDVREASGGHQGSVLILAGDTPLLQGSSLKALLDSQARTERRVCDRYRRHSTTTMAWAELFATAPAHFSVLSSKRMRLAGTAKDHRDQHRLLCLQHAYCCCQH